MPGGWRERLQALKQHLAAVWFSTRHPRTPVLAKVIAVAVVAYAFSPIDLIPDFIPVLGYLDDLLLLPLGIWLVLRLVPDDVMAECQAQAAHWLEQKNPRPRSYAAAGIILLLWLGLAWLTWTWLQPMLRG